MMAGGNQKGVALLLVLTITTLLAALLTQLSFSTLIDLRLAETFRDSTRAYYLAKGGLHVGQTLLRNDQSGYDGDDELWAQPINHYPVAEGAAVSIHIEALDGRININRLVSSSGNIDAVVKDRCLRLFEVLEIANPHTKLDAIIDWLDPDDDPQPAGAENSYYQFLDPPGYCKNAALDSLDELQQVAGISRDDLRRLRPHLSVYGDNKIHLNSASSQVLYALANEMDLSSAELIVEQRRGAPYQSVEELKLLPGWETFYWAINTQLRVTADYYQIDTDAVIGDGRRRVRATLYKPNNTLLYFKIF